MTNEKRAERWLAEFFAMILGRNHVGSLTALFNEAEARGAAKMKAAILAKREWATFDGRVYASQVVAVDDIEKVEVE